MKKREKGGACVRFAGINASLLLLWLQNSDKYEDTILTLSYYCAHFIGRGGDFAVYSARDLVF